MVEKSGTEISSLQGKIKFTEQRNNLECTNKEKSKLFKDSKLWEIWNNPLRNWMIWFWWEHSRVVWRYIRQNSGRKNEAQKPIDEEKEGADSSEVN